MSRNRNNSNILSSVGTVFEMLANLRKEGVTDIDIRKMLSDPTHVARVGNVMRMGPEPKSFMELVALGGYDYHNDGFEEKYDDNWTNKGTHVRGDLHVIKMENDYCESDLKAVVANESRQHRRNLDLATAYEQAYYRLHGWNETDTVIAFGSKYVNPFGESFVPMLSKGDKPRLCLGSAKYTWNAHDHVLVVSR